MTELLRAVATLHRDGYMLGVLSHFDSYNLRKVLVWEAGLRRHGDVSGDCLRFSPDRIQFQLKATSREGDSR